MLRRILLWLCVLTLLTAGSASAAALPMDDHSGGYPYQESGVLGKYEYKDDSIYANVLTYNYKKCRCRIAYVTIEDPSQLRTAFSNGTYGDHRYVKTKLLARSVNAIVAVNGDFVKYNNFGYTVRQSTLYREVPDGAHDVLFIDNYGDFTALKEATLEDVLAHVGMFEDGRYVVNSFNFGPILVVDGATVPITVNYYQATYMQQRVALAQIEGNRYAIIQCDGSVNSTSGLTLEDFAAFIAETIPGCKLAYNLDGGGSAHVIFLGRQINDNDGGRDVSDIVYFASADQPDGEN